MKWLLKWLLRLALLLVLALGCALAYLDVYGFPPWLVRIVEQHFARAGYRMEAREIHFDWLRGVVATDLVLADLKTPDRPLGRLDEVQLQVDFRKLGKKQNAIRGLRVANANLSVPVGGELFTAQGANATVRFAQDGTINIEQLTGVYCGINLRVRGSIKPTRATVATVEPRSMQGQLAFLTKTLRELNSLAAKEPPQLDLDFTLDLANPWGGHVLLKLLGSGLSYRQVGVDSVWLHLEMRERAIRLVACDIASAAGALNLSGQYDLGAGQFDLQLASTLHPSVLAPVLPAKAGQLLQEVRIGARPKIKARYWLSPETGSLPKLTGTIELGDIAARGAEFRSIYAEVEYQGIDVFFRDVRAITAEGRLIGHGQFNIESSDFAYELDSTLDPGKLLAFMPPGVRNFVEPSKFQKPPRIKASVTGDFVDPELFAYDATFAVRKGSYRGVEFEDASAKLRLRRNKLEVRDFVLGGADGEIRGTLHVDFNRHRTAFDLRTTANPVPLAAMLGPKAAEFATPYRFGRGTQGAARGVADFANPRGTTWTAAFTNNGFGAWSFAADQVQADLAFTNNVLTAAGTARGAKHGALAAERATARFTVVTNSAAGTVDAHGVKAWGLRAAEAKGEFAYVGGDLALTTRAKQVKGWSLSADEGEARVAVHSNVTQVAVDTTGFGWWKLKATRARGDVLVSNEAVQVSNFAGDLYDGKITGSAKFRSNPSEYDLNLKVERSNIELLMDGIREKPGRRITGFLNGNIALHGTGTNAADMVGNGALRINDGILWRAALFGVFSKVLGDTKATAATASFTITNRVLRADDLQVAAGAFTGKSHGSVDFDGNLDFRVQGQFMQSWPGINWITAILGKVLEYKVGGTLADPSYRPVNLPKELLPHD